MAGRSEARLEQVQQALDAVRLPVLRAELVRDDGEERAVVAREHVVRHRLRERVLHARVAVNTGVGAAHSCRAKKYELLQLRRLRSAATPRQRRMHSAWRLHSMTRTPLANSELRPRLEERELEVRRPHDEVAAAVEDDSVAVALVPAKELYAVHDDVLVVDHVPRVRHHLRVLGRKRVVACMCTARLKYLLGQCRVKS
jgi:hypothetical protein